MFRLGLICDFKEESWTSMDVVADMLFEQIGARHAESIQVDRIRPSFTRRASAPYPLRTSRAAWNADRLCNRMVDYPRRLRAQSEAYDVFHIVDHSYAHLALSLPRDRTVITCHDLDAFRCLTEPATEPRPLWFRVMAQRILKGMQAAAHVVFVSEAVREEAIRQKLIVKEACSVVYNGVSDDLGGGGEADREADDLLGDDASRPFLLSVGSTVPRKRVDTLLHVVAGVMNMHPDVRLIRLGGTLADAQWNLARRLGIAESIVELPFVSRERLGAIYRRATVLLQPSEREGFALPVAEAMACGCPVVASDISVLREIGGAAAVYCRVGDAAQWARRVVDLLNLWREKPEARKRAQLLSINNAERFRWDEAADKLAGVYGNVLAKTCGGGGYACNVA